MIHEFRVSNFLSFKEEQILSFEATSDKTFEGFFCVRKRANLRLLKLGMIYGANASGKSNLLKAIDYLRQLAIKRPADKTTPIDLPQFAFDPAYQEKPTTFYLSFFIGHTRFIYSLSLNKDVILEERLAFYPGTQPAVAFERVYDEKEDKAHIDFGDKLGLGARERLILEGAVFRNSTVLAAYNNANVSSSILSNVSKWFKSKLHGTIQSYSGLLLRTNALIEKDQPFKASILEAMRKADFNISDVQIRENKGLSGQMVFPTTIAFDYLDEKIDRLLNQSKEAVFIHETKDGHVELPMQAQSEGTKRFYGLASLLYSLKQQNAVIAIDELESSLHFELVNHFLRTFLANTTEAQLIFTTHNIQILAEDFLRRDVIWFTEKQEDGSTELFAYADVKLHKNISPFNAYKIGKLGAKPELGEIYMD
ncbi:MAG: ATP-binding protein [Lewinellaceae bacterium]|nr:ATP-binding protein [Lewinellaceae bacterium]